MKKVLLLALLTLVSTFCTAQSSAIAVVTQFGNEISKFCRDKSVSAHEEKILGFTSGEDKCKLETKFMDYYHEDTYGAGNKLISSYMTDLETNIEKGLSFKMTNVKIAYDFEVPTGKHEKSAIFVQADIEYSGSLQLTTTDIFFVSNGKITNIIDSNTKMAEAGRAYRRNNYERAFQLYREIAYAKFDNFEAQYYTALLEIYKKGCKNVFCDEMRDMEAVLLTLRIVGYANNSYELQGKAKALAIAYRMDLDYGVRQNDNYGIRLLFRPMDSDRVLYYNSSTKKYGFKNLAGRIVIPCNFAYAYPFHDGRALIKTDNGKFAFIDVNGNIVTSIYDSANIAFFNGRCYCISNGVAYMIDKNDKRLAVVKDIKYKAVRPWFGKFAMLVRDDNGTLDIYKYSGESSNYVGQNLHVDFDQTNLMCRIKNRHSEEVLNFKYEW